MNRLHLALFLVLTSSSTAQVFDERFEDWPADLRIGGAAVVAGTLSDVAVLARANIRLSEEARVVALVDEGVSDERAASYQGAFPGEGRVFQTVRYKGRSVEFGPLLEGCEVLCWETSREPTGEECDHWLAARKQFSAHVASGGVVVAVGPGATMLGKHLPGDTFGTTRPGLGLLPDTSIDVTFDGTRAGWSELLGVQAVRPRCVAIGVPPDTALVPQWAPLLGRRGRALRPSDSPPMTVNPVGTRTSPPAARAGRG